MRVDIGGSLIGTYNFAHVPDQPLVGNGIREKTHIVEGQKVAKSREIFTYRFSLFYSFSHSFNQKHLLSTYYM